MSTKTKKNKIEKKKKKKKTSSSLFKNVIFKICLEIIYSIYV